MPKSTKTVSGGSSTITVTETVSKAVGPKKTKVQKKAKEPAPKRENRVTFLVFGGKPAKALLNKVGGSTMKTDAKQLVDANAVVFIENVLSAALPLMEATGRTTLQAKHIRKALELGFNINMLNTDDKTKKHKRGGGDEKEEKKKEKKKKA